MPPSVEEGEHDGNNINRASKVVQYFYVSSFVADLRYAGTWLYHNTKSFLSLLKGLRSPDLIKVVCDQL